MTLFFHIPKSHVPTLSRVISALFCDLSFSVWVCGISCLENVPLVLADGTTPTAHRICVYYDGTAENPMLPPLPISAPAIQEVLIFSFSFFIMFVKALFSAQD